MSEATGVCLDGVWKFYGDYPAVRDCTFAIPSGACCACLGRNGAGKTTLLRILAGLTPFQRGSVRVLNEQPRSERARRHTGFLGHGISLYEDLSARENLSFFARLAGTPFQRQTADQWLSRVGLGRVADMPVRQLSRGMRQRLALARTFAPAPQVLILDEPFTSLDDRAIDTLTGLLGQARESGATIILSTHQLSEALAVASHVLLIENGRIRYSGERTPAMSADPGLLYRSYLQPE